MYFLQSDISYILGPNTFLGSLFSNTLNLHYSPDRDREKKKERERYRDQVLHPYETICLDTDKFIDLKRETDAGMFVR
jgi:hypothetical protein